MRRSGFSIRSKLLTFAVGLSIVPFVLYLVWAGITHSQEQKLYEAQAQQSYGWMLSNAINAHFYGFVNEQLESFSTLKNSLAVLGNSAERLTAQKVSHEALETYLQSLTDEKMKVFIFSRESEKRNSNVTAWVQELMRALDLRGQPLLQHLLRDRLSAEGFYFYLRDSYDQSCVAYLKPLSAASDLIFAAVADVDDIKKEYSENSQYGIFESFNILMENIPASQIGNVYILDSRRKTLASRTDLQGFDPAALPPALFAQARDNYRSSMDLDYLDEMSVEVNYIKPLDWYVLLLKPQNMLQIHMTALAIWLSVCCVLCAVIAVFIALLLARSIERTFERLAKAADKVADEVLASPADLITRTDRFDEFTDGDHSRVFEAFKRMLRSIQNSMQQLLRSQALEQRSQVLAEAANTLKISQLPFIDSLNLDPRLKIAVEQQRPADCGGDFYDVIELDENRRLIVLGTVSGAGMQAATNITVTLTLLRQLMRSGIGFEEALTRFNELLRRNHHRGDRVALFACCMNLADGRIDYACLGMPHAWLCRRDGILQPLQVSDNRRLGFGDNRCLAFGETMCKGDVILAYTSGLLELPNELGQQLGPEHLHAFLSRIYQLDDLAAKLGAMIQNFRQEGVLPADATVLTAKLMQNRMPLCRRSSGQAHDADAARAERGLHVMPRRQPRRHELPESTQSTDKA